MASGQPSVGRSIAFAAVMYLVQTAVLLLVVFHDFSNKDTAIVVSLLIMMYGINTSQMASESAISGLHFVTLVRLVARLKGTVQTDVESDLQEMTKKDTPFGFVHTLFGLLIAIIGAAKLIYTLFT
jgi:hypothetical protein